MAKKTSNYFKRAQKMVARKAYKEAASRNLKTRAVSKALNLGKYK